MRSLPRQHGRLQLRGAQREAAAAAAAAEEEEEEEARTGTAEDVSQACSPSCRHCCTSRAGCRRTSSRQQAYCTWRASPTSLRSRAGTWGSVQPCKTCYHHHHHYDHITATTIIIITIIIIIIVIISIVIITIVIIKNNNNHNYNGNLQRRSLQ